VDITRPGAEPDVRGQGKVVRPSATQVQPAPQISGIHTGGPGLKAKR
jgi:hypothetical protein